MRIPFPNVLAVGYTDKRNWQRVYPKSRIEKAGAHVLCVEFRPSLWLGHVATVSWQPNWSNLLRDEFPQTIWGLTRRSVRRKVAKVGGFAVDPAEIQEKVETPT